VAGGISRAGIRNNARTQHYCFLFSSTSTTVQVLYEDNSRDSLEKMDEAVEDEKKPFDAEAGAEDDSQPDPDEQLMLDQGNGRVWLVKVRRS
jgi:hypothetical protein